MLSLCIRLICAIAHSCDKISAHFFFFLSCRMRSTSFWKFTSLFSFISAMRRIFNAPHMIYSSNWIDSIFSGAFFRGIELSGHHVNMCTPKRNAVSSSLCHWKDGAAPSAAFRHRVSGNDTHTNHILNQHNSMFHFWRRRHGTNATKSKRNDFSCTLFSRRTHHNSLNRFFSFAPLLRFAPSFHSKNRKYSEKIGRQFLSASIAFNVHCGCFHLLFWSK